jgi:hypothetical protein
VTTHCSPSRPTRHRSRPLPHRNGRWLDHHELTSSRPPSLHRSRAPRHHHLQQRRGDLKCPVCGEGMTAFNYRAYNLELTSAPGARLLAGRRRRRPRPRHHRRRVRGLACAQRRSCLGRLPRQTKGRPRRLRRQPRPTNRSCRPSGLPAQHPSPDTCHPSPTPRAAPLPLPLQPHLLRRAPVDVRHLPRVQPRIRIDLRPVVHLVLQAHHQDPAILPASRPYRSSAPGAPATPAASLQPLGNSPATRAPDPVLPRVHRPHRPVEEPSSPRTPARSTAVIPPCVARCP